MPSVGRLRAGWLRRLAMVGMAATETSLRALTRRLLALPPEQRAAALQKEIDALVEEIVGRHSKALVLAAKRGIIEAGVRRGIRARIDEDALRRRLSRSVHRSLGQVAGQYAGAVRQILAGRESLTMAVQRASDSSGVRPGVRPRQSAKRATRAARQAVLSTDPRDRLRFAKRLAAFQRDAEALGRGPDGVEARIWSKLRGASLRAAQELRSAVELQSVEMADSALKWLAYHKQSYHMRMIARTETSRAYHDRFMDAASRSSVVTGFRWRVEPGHETCEVCGPRDRRVYGKGEVPEIPAHPNCMCWLQPVVSTEEE